MRLSFGFKMGLAICLLSVSMTTVGVLYFYQTARDKIWNLMSGRVMDIARTGLFLLPYEERDKIQRFRSYIEAVRLKKTDEEFKAIPEGEFEDGLDEATNAAAIANADFQSIVTRLRHIKFGSRREATPPIPLPQKYGPVDDRPMIRYVYILTSIAEVPDRSVVQILIDGDYEEIDMNENGNIEPDEEATTPGIYYNIVGQDGINKAFAGKVAPNSDYTVDTWGTWVSAFAPIHDRQGNVIAVLGVDYKADSEFNEVVRLKYICWALIAGSIVLSILLSYALARFLGRPIQLLREGAERVRDRDYSARVDIRSSDELGLLARSFNSMVDQIRDYTANLEQKVAERTAELEHTLRTVQDLKSQQDADYFLTNLLANPLFKNYNKSNSVTTDFYIKQKKQFEFRNRTVDLGGDMCVSGNLIFSGRRHTMFCNADAMGKSMQGAGGALVMGTVLNSIMDRSASNKRNLKISVEQWLQNTYTELHNIFLTFDGSMHVSCVLGVLDDESGTLHYFNAEHPAPVLYRRGKAALLEEPGLIRKLGSHIESEFLVQKIQLEPGDVIIVGSDGKDDLNLTPNQETRTINSDEELFVRIVEAAHGKIDTIISALEEYGDLTDDISLIRVSYLEYPVERKSELDLERLNTLIQARNYVAALEELNKIEPDAAGVLVRYYKGLCLARLGRHAEALPFLEQAVDLEEKQATTLSLLGKIYYSLSRYEEASRSLERALELKPDSENLQNALEVIRQKAGLLQ